MTSFYSLRILSFSNAFRSANPLGECHPAQFSALARECFSAVPRLRELAARAVMRGGGPTRGGTVVARLPAVVERYLEAGGRCSCCGGAFFQQHATFLTACVTRIFLFSWVVGLVKDSPCSSVCVGGGPVVLSGCASTHLASTMLIRLDLSYHGLLSVPLCTWHRIAAFWIYIFSHTRSVSRCSYVCPAFVFFHAIHCGCVVDFGALATVNVSLSAGTTPPVSPSRWSTCLQEPL